MIPKITKTSSGEILLDGQELNVRRWTLCPSNQSGVAISARGAFEHLSKSRSLRNIVVGIIGPRDATNEQMISAERTAYLLAELGITLICGGKSGVMQAASKGCHDAGGLLVGILPGSTPDEANEFVGVPLPTGLGEARNMIIAKSARVLVAVGGSYGTLSEVAYGLHFSKPVIGLAGAADVDGVVHMNDPEAAVHAVLEALFFCAAHPDSEEGCKITYSAIQ
ncbi:MAG: TIGR00725 family protein [Planktomarina temperata]|nr:TIGR00725 family protein [Planktomarina temperata]